MKKVFVSLTVISSIFFATPSFAEEGVESNSTETSEIVAEPTPEPTPDPTPDPTPEPTPDPTPDPTQEPTQEPTPTYAPGMAPGEHAGWIAVDPNGNPVSDGMVCTPEVCAQTGPGSWLELAYGPNTNIRLVLQTLQDPVEAAKSHNGIGNVATYSGGRYNFETGQWTVVGPDGGIYQIPLAYPGLDSGGNENSPLCIENCPPPPCEEDPNYLDREDCIEYIDVEVPSNTFSSSTTTIESPNMTTIENDETIVERSKSFVIKNNEKGFNKVKISFYKKTNNIKIIAKKWGEAGVQQKEWNIKKKSFTKHHVFKIPKKFIDWKIIVKNKKNIKNIVLL